MTGADRSSRLELGAAAHALAIPLLLVESGTGRLLDANAAAAHACDLGTAPRDRTLFELTSSPESRVRDCLMTASGTRSGLLGSLEFGLTGDPYRVEGGVLHPQSADRAAVLLLKLQSRATSASPFRLLNEKIDELTGEAGARQRIETLLAGQRLALEQMAAGEPVEAVLETLVSATEKHSNDNLIASVLLLDQEGRHLLHGAAPSLPQAYCDAIDGIEIGERVGSCGTAAHRNESVVVEDIEHDPLWADFAGLALEHGLRACWSTPIRGREGEVLGTFALYYREPRMPPESDQRVVALVTRTASVAIERHREQRRIEQLLASERAARAEAEGANRAKDEFLALVSHELRNPLSAILGWTRLLQMGGLDEESLREGVETIERNVELQSQLIADVLDFSRGNTGKLKLNVREVDLDPFLATVIDSLRPAAEAANIRIDYHGEPEIGLIGCDPDRMQQVMSNLVSNAVKFTPAGGTIRVNLSRDDGQVVIRIVDDGEGIDADFLPHVFETFRQADASQARRHGGLGLGLAVVRQITELHGGDVDAASAGPEKGSTFTVRFPIRTVSAIPPDHEAERDSDLTGIHILAVDDQADARKLLDAVLSRHGARTTVAASAEEALTILRTVQPDVIVSDISMPGTDGYSLLRRVRSARNGLPSIPAVAVTAQARDIDEERSRDAGFDAHLSKPFEPEQLARTVLGLVRSNRTEPPDG